MSARFDSHGAAGGGGACPVERKMNGELCIGEKKDMIDMILFNTILTSKWQVTRNVKRRFLRRAFSLLIFPPTVRCAYMIVRGSKAEM